MPPLTAAKVTAAALRDAIGARFGQEPVMVATSGLSTALMAAPDAEPGYLGLVPATAPFRNEVAARVALGITTHIPGRKAANVNCPILFCICETDSVAPVKATLRHARKARRAEIKRYPEGHFDIYVADALERVVVDQIRFLSTHVPLNDANAKGPSA